MNENRLTDYLHHMEQAATDACGFVEGLPKEDFLEDKRTQQAVIMSLIIIGEAVTKIMDGYTEFTQAHAQTLPRYAHTPVMLRAVAASRKVCRTL